MEESQEITTVVKSPKIDFELSTTSKFEKSYDDKRRIVTDKSIVAGGMPSGSKRNNEDDIYGCHLSDNNNNNVYLATSGDGNPNMSTGGKVKEQAAESPYHK